MENMEREGPSKKQKRYKVQCGLCKKTFYNDYRPNHNKKYHSDYVKGKRPIPFHIPRAPLSPFTAVSYKRAQNSEKPATTKVIGLFCTILIQMLFKLLR